MVRRLLLPNGWPSHFTCSWSNMISYWTVFAYYNTLVGDAADWDSLNQSRDWWMGQETEGRRGCRVRVLKAGVFLKIYTVYKTGRTVASVTNDLPSLAILSVPPVIFILISGFITSYRWEFVPFPVTSLVILYVKRFQKISAKDASLMSCIIFWKWQNICRVEADRIRSR